MGKQEVIASHCRGLRILLPPSLRDWLPEGHLAYFVSDVVEQLDLSAIESVYEEEERGQPPYHPGMMTKILIYGYCVGVFSSRRMQKKLSPEVDMAKLVYFALSIFWRGTRHWSAVEGGQPPKLYLGRQEKAIRAFLLARGKLPEDVVVTVAVWPYKKVYPMAMMPRADAGTGYRSYWFYFFGFIFLLALGRKTCNSSGPARITLRRSS